MNKLTHSTANLGMQSNVTFMALNICLITDSKALCPLHKDLIIHKSFAVYFWKKKIQTSRSFMLVEDCFEKVFISFIEFLGLHHNFCQIYINTRRTFVVFDRTRYSLYTYNRKAEKGGDNACILF